MKTNEFIKKVEELGYLTQIDDNTIEIYGVHGLYLSMLTNKVHKLRTYWDRHVPADLFDLAVEYVKTPIPEREEVKKYYLVPHGYRFADNCFNYFKVEENWTIMNKNQEQYVQTQFTQEEIDNHKYSDIMKTFEKVEVDYE